MSRIIKFEKKKCPKCVSVQNFFNDQDIEVEKVDVETSTNLDFISKYVSMTLPVVVLLDDNEQLVKKSEGFEPGELEEIVSLSNN